MSNSVKNCQFNKIWLKKLNSRIFKNKKLNLSKILKID